jgi:ADP-heptose:LPS heptosyltransferase
MKEILFVLGGGIGNICQATPTIKLIASSGYVVDLLLRCNSSRDVVDIFSIPAVRKVYLKEPQKKYHAQLNGPFTKIRVNADHFFKTRINYAQYKPEALVYKDCATQLGIKGALPPPEINIGTRGPSPVSPKTVAIFPGSKPEWAMKRWDKYDKLAEMLGDVVVVGKPEDFKSHGNPAWIKRPWAWPNSTKFFSGKLQEAAFLLSQCKAFIGNDGALSHLSAATGVPTFVIFGPTSVVKNLPFSNAYALGKDMKCRPCQYKTKNRKQHFRPKKTSCPFGMACMNELTAEMVLKQIHELNPGLLT